MRKILLLLILLISTTASAINYDTTGVIGVNYAINKPACFQECNYYHLTPLYKLASSQQEQFIRLTEIISQDVSGKPQFSTAQLGLFDNKAFKIRLGKMGIMQGLYPINESTFLSTPERPLTASPFLRLFTSAITPKYGVQAQYEFDNGINVSVSEYKPKTISFEKILATELYTTKLSKEQIKQIQSINGFIVTDDRKFSQITNVAISIPISKSTLTYDVFVMEGNLNTVTVHTISQQFSAGNLTFEGQHTLFYGANSVIINDDLINVVYEINNIKLFTNVSATNGNFSSHSATIGSILSYKIDKHLDFHVRPSVTYIRGPLAVLGIEDPPPQTYASVAIGVSF